MNKNIIINPMSEEDSSKTPTVIKFHHGSEMNIFNSSVSKNVENGAKSYSHPMKN